MISVIYAVDAPYSDQVIEVYGEADMGWYEWRVVEAGRIVQDTKNKGYGNASIALRDALIAMSA